MLHHVLQVLFLQALNRAFASANSFGPTPRRVFESQLPWREPGVTTNNEPLSDHNKVTKVDQLAAAISEELVPGSLSSTGTFHEVGLRAFAKPNGLMDYEKILQTHVENRKVSIAALLVWACFLTWMLVTTAEYFFCPPLMYWTRKLKLQPEVAGATLLAFGNGAPDVFTAQAAIGAQDIPLLLGEMLGANAFLLCVVMGSLILASQGKQTAVPAKSRFLYNIVWYILAVLANFIIISDGTITVAESVFLLSSYACYVFSLVYWNARQPDTKVHGKQDKRLNYGSVAHPQQPAPVEEDAIGPNGERLSGDWVQGTITALPSNPPLQGLTPPNSGSILTYFFFGAAWPFYVIRWITIPPSDDCWDSTRRTLCALSPLGVVSLCYTAFGSEADIITWAIVSAGASLVGAAAYCATDDGPDTPCLYPAFTLLAKVSSCIWLAVLAAELTNVVKALGVVSGIPSALLGITVVAWGNSFGDLLSGLSVTRSGDGRLAVIAVFSSPLFSNLVGFGISSWMAAKQAGGRAVIWQAQDVQTRIMILMPLLAGLVCVLLSAIIIWIAYHSVEYSSVPKAYWAFGLFACYGIFMGLEILDVISPIGQPST